MRVSRAGVIDSFKPTVYYATLTRLEFEFERELPSGAEYNLALSLDCRRETPPLALAKATASGRSLQFELDTFTAAFERACAFNRNCRMEIAGCGEVLLQDTIAIAPRVDVEGRPPESQPRYPTFEQVAALIAGNPGKSDREGSSFYPPVANYLVNDATYGAVYYLDSTIPAITFPERVLNLKKVRLRLVSANPAVTGNIVVVPAVDGVDQAPVTLAVGATAETREIEFASAVSGRFSLRRDYTAAADTLDAVTAIVTALRILEV
ncbi:MAG: hypothetical protein AB7F32_06395 [Victivallaceae bacterium]